MPRPPLAAAAAAALLVPGVALAEGAGVGALFGSGGALLDTSGNLSQLLNNIYIAGVGAVAVLAVVMIIWGAIQVVGMGESAGKVSSGKEKIWNAVWGLLLALGSMVLLRTISQSFQTAEFLGGAGAVNTEGAGASPAAPSQGGATPNRGPDGGGTSASGDGLNDQYGGGGGYGSGSLTTNGAGDYDGLTIAESTRRGMGFPNQDWNSYALQQVRNSGLLSLSPSDASRYFPNGPTAEGYVSLLASIAQSESSFNPSDNLNHSGGTDVGSTYSVGLFSLSEGDSAVRNLGFSEQDLGNPYNSIQAATQILYNQIQNSGSITGGSGTGRNGHYWGPLYRGE